MTPTPDLFSGFGDVVPHLTAALSSDPTSIELFAAAGLLGLMYFWWRRMRAVHK